MTRLCALASSGAFVLWLSLRLFWGGPLQVWSVTTSQGQLPFLFLDLSWVVFALFAVASWRHPAWQRVAPYHVAALAFAALVSASVHALTRYYGGAALAWDLGNFVQPMWRASAGEGLISSWHGDLPLWSDHGSFALYAFAPLTRLFDDAGSGPLLAQAALTAAFVPACYALARSLELSPRDALWIACAAFVSRPLSYAASFDFHPECALPLLLVLAVWAERRGRLLTLAGLVLCAALLKDMAALSVGAACCFLALRARDWRVFALGAAALGIAAVDIAYLPRATGWASYLTINTSAPVDPALAWKTTAMRALSTGLVGSLHPFGLIAGAPWTLAAALSPKLLVKGVQFQYGYLFVGSALVGAALSARWLGMRTAWAPRLIALWAVACVALNAPRPIDMGRVSDARAAFVARRALLAQLAGDARELATDACSAAYLMERPRVLPLCQIDVRSFAATGEERWDVPDPRALQSPLILVQRSCTLHGSCWSEQLKRAARGGYRVVFDRQGWLALRMPTQAR